MFSKPVILDIISTLPNEYNQLEQFMIRNDLDERISIEGLSTSKIKTAITKFLISNQELRNQFGNYMVNEIVEDRINNYLLASLNEFDKDERLFLNYPELYKYLRYDGFDIEDNKLIRTIPDNIVEHHKDDEIEKMLQKHQFTTSIGHLENAKSSYFNANYAAMTSQLRTYVESLFIDMAKIIKSKDTGCPAISNIQPVDATTAMQILAKCMKPVIDQNLNEWDGGSKKTFIEGFFKRLHPQGSHPGLPELDESVFRLQLVLLVSFYLLKKFDNNY